MRLPAPVVHKLPSRSDKWGCVYVFEIPEEQPDLPLGEIEKDPEFKIGRALEPPKRQGQWRRKCRGQEQRWICYWEVVYAAKFGACPLLFSFLRSEWFLFLEALIHAHFKKVGAWNTPTECAFCGTRHIEKFDAKACGGLLGVMRVVEKYLRLLNWPCRRWVVPSHTQCFFLTCNRVWMRN
jgi:hypothetical protein